MAESLRVASKTVKRRADQFRENHPEWFKAFLDKAQKPSEHYAPELVMKIKLLWAETKKNSGKISRKMEISQNQEA